MTFLAMSNQFGNQYECGISAQPEQLLAFSLGFGIESPCLSCVLQCVG